MWKKSEASVTPPTPVKTPTPPSVETSTARKARIGAGVSLKGELVGKEDIIIEGHIEGTITLDKHGVIIEIGASIVTRDSSRCPQATAR